LGCGLHRQRSLHAGNHHASSRPKNAGV
jgi:hypothetical protein